MKKLVAIQTNLKAPKGNYNSFGKYKYRSCEDIVEAVKPLLAEQACILNLSDEMVMLGNRFYIKATATIIDTESGDQISSFAYAREEETKKGMDASQITGSASSYARKYALNGLFAIDDGVDADRTNTHGKIEKSDPNTVDQIFTDKPVFDSDKFASFKAWSLDKTKSEILAKYREITDKYAIDSVVLMDLEQFTSNLT